MNDLVIRPYQTQDEAAILELWLKCNLVVPQNNPERDIKRKLQVNPEWFLVGVVDGKVVATCMAGYEGHRGWINYLAVSPKYRRQGIGMRIMEEAENRLRSGGCPKINLQVRETNQEVIRFYAEIGYTKGPGGQHGEETANTTNRPRPHPQRTKVRMTAILFENEEVIAFDKPEGLASIPERGTGESLLTMISARFSEKLYVVHRLDKEVSGVIVFARNAVAHKHLNEQFSNREIKKIYVGLTHGVIRENRAVIDKPIRQFGSGRMGVDPERGKASVTEFRVKERFRSHTLIDAYPYSGRRHQIRVHLYSIGHPIVGDLRYGDKELQQDYGRLMLHGRSITFKLTSSEVVTVESPLPEGLKDFIQRSSYSGR